ncbi:MAG: hypothetical protein ACFE0R_07820 [Salinarimonas sp.]
MKLPRIEAVPKRVLLLELRDGTFPTRPGIDASLFRANMMDIIDRIEDGVPLPGHYYRRSVGRDFLLERFGWLHLHVGHDVDDGVLLVVEQLEDRVILICLTDHTIFAERPRARSILRLRSKVEAAKLRRI